MEQEAKQHPYIGHIARSMQRMAHEYAKQIITRQLDVTTGKPVTRRAVKVQYNPDCVYLQALNNRNAMRKLVKAGYIKMVKQDGKGPHVED